MNPTNTQVPLVRSLSQDFGWVDEEFETFHRSPSNLSDMDDSAGGCSSEEEKYDSDNQQNRGMRGYHAPQVYEPQPPQEQYAMHQGRFNVSHHIPKRGSGPPYELQQPVPSLIRSYDINDGVFIRGDIAISEYGVAMQNNPRAFDVSFEDLSVHENIGSGASSHVKRAVHVPTGTQLALKIISMQNEQTRGQLAQEIRSLYNTECVSIVAFHGAYFRQGQISIALEYMNGGSLVNVLKSVGFIREAALANIIYQALWGLAYLHNEGRIHRDIKPSNILINSEGEVKLTDFGVSTELNNSIGMCNTFVGTFRYMSPERVRHVPYGSPTDIWALGIVLLECATGSYPFHVGPGTPQIALAYTVLEEDPPTLPANSSNMFFSDAMRDFASLCVPKSPNDRYNAETLLAHPWLASHGAVSVKAAAANVKSWIESLQTC